MMVSSYPIHFTAQLRQHLKALRTSRNLTQAQLGAVLGVSQARIAEIEANPGLVKFEQLMQLLTALDVKLILTEGKAELQAPTAAPPSNNIQPILKSNVTMRPKKGIW